MARTEREYENQKKNNKKKPKHKKMEPYNRKKSWK